MQSFGKRNAFTLIEMLIVIVVLVTLMSITFRLSSLGSESERRITTITRLQRLENCLSGYHAAFGSYPPVQLHGSQDIYLAVDDHGIQTSSRNEAVLDDNDETRAWLQVKAACAAQPIDCRYPFPEGYSERIIAISEEMKERANSNDSDYREYWSNPSVQKRLSAGFDDGVSGEIGRHSNNKQYTQWVDVQLFKFGLLSYLLPRYLIMMNGDEEFFEDFAQWTENNTRPCNPYTGDQYSTWRMVKELADASDSNNSSTAKEGIHELAAIPSQAVCARWMPNLENICACNYNMRSKTFGVEIRDTRFPGLLRVEDPYIEIFSPEGGSSTSGQYILDGVTVFDGWHRPFFYYSPQPYQTYTIWSAGQNGKTFPPWIDRTTLQSKSTTARERVANWIVDDIIHMSN